MVKLGLAYAVCYGIGNWLGSMVPGEGLHLVSRPVAMAIFGGITFAIAWAARGVLGSRR